MIESRDDKRGRNEASSSRLARLLPAALIILVIQATAVALLLVAAMLEPASDSPDGLRELSNP